MKHFFYLFLTGLLITFADINRANAQQINSKIQEVYGERTQSFAVENPEMIAFFNNLLDNRIKIQELSPETDRSKFVRLSQVGLLNKYNPAIQRDIAFNPETFNPLKYDMEFTSPNVKRVYVVDNTNYVIIIEPQTTNR